MARIEWIKHRLDNWANWKARNQDGGLGWASQAAFLNEYSSDRYREARIPIDDVDAGVTDQAVEALLPDQAHLYRTLHHIYLLGLGIKETSRREGVAESTVNARLAASDAAIRAWFNARTR
jgi:hypothetical protein